MIRRWLIRAFFLLALAFVVGVWVTSYFGGIAAGGYMDGRTASVGVIQGLGCIIEADYPIHKSHIQINYQRYETAKDWDIEPTILGFRIDTSWQTNPGVLLIVFPLWLPTVLLSALCWFVWRLPRRKAKQGFPIVPIAKESPSTDHGPLPTGYSPNDSIPR